jgi:hypothetical protein
MIGRKSSGALVLGGSPRADLLPPEIKAEVKAKAQRRTMIAVVVGAVVVVIAAYLPATLAATTASDRLVDEQSRSATLLGEKGKYVSVEQLEAQLAAAKAARVVGSSTEIDWSSYLAGVAATFPSDATLEKTVITSATPITSLTPPTAALQGPRVAELVFTIRSQKVPVVGDWLKSLQDLTGYVDASIDTITSEDEALTSILTLHIDERAYSNRYTLESEGLVK